MDILLLILYTVLNLVPGKFIVQISSRRPSHCITVLGATSEPRIFSLYNCLFAQPVWFAGRFPKGLACTGRSFQLCQIDQSIFTILKKNRTVSITMEGNLVKYFYLPHSLNNLGTHGRLTLLTIVRTEKLQLYMSCDILLTKLHD